MPQIHKLPWFFEMILQIEPPLPVGMILAEPKITLK